LVHEVVGARVAIQGNAPNADDYLSTLHNLLIEPVVRAGFAPADYARWIIVPDGPLHFVPFPALIGPDGHRLIADVPLGVAPSGSVFHYLRRRSRRGSPASYLALIDPDLAHVPRPRLRQAAAEVAALQHALSRLPGVTIEGGEANEPALRRFAPGRSIVHLTTHGEFPENDAIDLHRVLLAKSEADDGRLHAEEIRRLDLSEAMLLTLHVCDAGLFRIGPGDEQYGLVPAVFMAGADNVLATLWPVEHEVSRHFMAAFYDALLESGPVEALQRAAMAFIADDEPLRYWAGFALSGSASSFDTGV
jgi:CHAT domain-containing protein